MAAVIFKMVLRWYLLYFLVDNSSHSDNFFIVSNTSIQGQKVLNPFFFVRQIVF